MLFTKIRDKKTRFEDDYSFAVKENIRIIKRISEGGMGTVYKAAFEGMNGFEKIVALKILKKNKSREVLYTRYFINEAKLVARLVHQNIVQLNSLGVHNDNYYIVYEYISGTTLQEFMDIHKLLGQTIPTNLVVFIISNIARGLAYAHSSLDEFGVPCNIVHRDVCPRNIMLTTEGQPKLTDFGIAIARGGNNEHNFAGKPEYMSPEQACGHKVDFRSDIYSLGLVFFTLLVGDSARDYSLGNDFVLSQARCGDLPWEKISSDLDESYLAILKKMLSTDPNDRHQDTRQLVLELEESIYSGGYGPTSISFSEYLRMHMPHIFSNTDRHGAPVAYDPQSDDEKRTDVGLDEDDTVMI